MQCVKHIDVHVPGDDRINPGGRLLKSTPLVGIKYKRRTIANIDIVVNAFRSNGHQTFSGDPEIILCTQYRAEQSSASVNARISIVNVNGVPTKKYYFHPDL